MKRMLMSVCVLAGCVLATAAWCVEPAAVGAADGVVVAKGPDGGHGPGDGTGTGDGTGGYGPGDCGAESATLLPLVAGRGKGHGYGPGDGTGTGDGTGGHGPGTCRYADA